jgi:hypothetical protein
MSRPPLSGGSGWFGLQKSEAEDLNAAIHKGSLRWHLVMRMRRVMTMMTEAQR